MSKSDGRAGCCGSGACAFPHQDDGQECLHSRVIECRGPPPASYGVLILAQLAPAHFTRVAPFRRCTSRRAAKEDTRAEGAGLKRVVAVGAVRLYTPLLQTGFVHPLMAPFTQARAEQPAAALVANSIAREERGAGQESRRMHIHIHIHTGSQAHTGTPAPPPPVQHAPWYF